MTLAQINILLKDHPILPWLVFMLGLFALYGGTLSFGLTYDDLLLVKHYSWDDLAKGFHSPWSERFYRPVVNFIFAAEFTAFGPHFWAYHLVNLLLLSIILLLFYRIVLAMGQAPWIGMLAGLLWMVLPGNAVLASWISTRTDTICILFYLLSILLFLQTNPARRNLKFGGSLLFAALAYLTKESAVTLPFILLAAMLFFRRENHIPKLRSPAPHFLLLIFYFIVRWWVLNGQVLGNKGFSQVAAVAQHRWAGLLGLFTRYLEALVSTVFPLFLMPSLLTALIVLTALTLFFWIGRTTPVRKNHYVIFLLLWMVITALPNVFDASPRLLGLPTLGCACLLVVLFSSCLIEFRSARYKLALAAFVYLFAMLEINGMVQNCFTRTVYESTLKYDVKDRRRWPFSDLKNLRYEIRQSVLAVINRHPQP